MRYEGSEVRSSGEGTDCRLEAGVLVGDEIEATEDGREGKSCESLSEAADVLLRLGGGGGRTSNCGVLRVVGEPMRKAEGTACSEGRLFGLGEPVWRGGVASCMCHGREPEYMTAACGVRDVCQLNLEATVNQSKL